MKMSMKWTTGILAVGMAVGINGAAAWAQNADAIDNARSIAKSLQQKQANDSDAALNAAGVPATKPASKPSQAPAPPAATKPAAPAQTAAVKPSPSAPASTKAAPAQAAKTTPAKPAPAQAQAAHAPVAKTPAAKPQPVKAEVKAPAAPKADPKAKAAPTSTIAAAPAPAKPVAAAKPAEAPKTADATKPETKKDDKDAKKDDKKEDKKWAMSGKRDPFFSPVVQQTGSGCSTGKKCLEIGAINLRGVVKSDNGFIAVVTNNLGKAYFLRENDPVFNGFVMRITGDSVVFQETIEDKLGKPFTREVVKKLFTPAV